MSEPEAMGAAGPATQPKGGKGRIAEVVAVNVLVLCALLAFLFARLTRPGYPSQEMIWIAHEHLDLGEAWEKSEFTRRIPIINKGRAAVDVLDVSTSCPCISITPRSFSLEPGDRFEVTLAANLSKLGDCGAPKERHTHEFVVTPIIRGHNPASLDRWTFRLVTRKLLEISPTRATFHDMIHPIRDVPSQTVTITSAIRCGSWMRNATQPNVQSTSSVDQRRSGQQSSLIQPFRPEGLRPRYC